MASCKCCRRFHPDENDQFRCHLQLLVTNIGLYDGGLEFTLHEYEVPKLEILIKSSYALRRNGHSRTNGTVVVIPLSKVEAFVQANLKDRILEEIERFGFLNVNVRHGRVLNWVFGQKSK